MDHFIAGAQALAHSWLVWGLAFWLILAFVAVALAGAAGRADRRDGRA